MISSSDLTSPLTVNPLMSRRVCVFFVSLLPGEGEDWASERSSERPADRLNDAAPGASEGLSHVLICTIFLLSKLGFTEPLPAMPSNSPAAAEPPQTPENDTANDVVRDHLALIYSIIYHYGCWFYSCTITIIIISWRKSFSWVKLDVSEWSKCPSKNISAAIKFLLIIEALTCHVLSQTMLSIHINGSTKQQMLQDVGSM